MEKQKQRLLAVDIVRGIAVILMIITHIWISFFWDHTNPIGTTLSYIGGFLSFSIFLIISGFTTGVSHRTLTLSKVLKRSATILFAYVVLGLTYTLLQKKDIYTLFSGPVYLEEFLLSLALFPVIAYGLIKLGSKLQIIKKILLHSIGAFFVILVGLLFVVLGKYTAQFNNSYLLSLFIGSSGFHTFPLVSYFVVYGVGIWLGWSYRLETAKNYGAEATAIILVSTITSLVALPLENISFSLQNLDAIRWPPTLFFITSGLAVSASLLYGATLLEKSLNNKFGKALQFIGKRAFLFFIAHLLFIYFVQGVVLAKVAQIPVPTVLPTPTTVSAIERVANTLTSTYENRAGWPFNGYKSAIITLAESTKSSAVYVEVKPQDIGSSAVGQDVTVYALTKDSGVKKLTKKVISINNNSLMLGFTVEPVYKMIVVAFSDEVTSPALPSVVEVITKKTKVSGTKLAKIDKNFANWSYQPYSMSGKRWYIQDTKAISEPTTFSAYLPISCDDLDLYLAKLAGELTVKYDGKVIPASGECSEITPYEFLPKDYTQALSKIAVPLVLDMKKQKSGKLTLKYELSLPNINGVEPFILEFNKYVAVSAPMYVAWTLDWEGINGAAYLSEISNVRAQNPQVPVTHMFNPRIWNSSSISKANADAQVAFVKNGRSKNGDEIALHLHMFTDMVTKAGVKQAAVPGWGNFGNGYDIPLSEFSYADAKKVFVWAINEFKKKGLPTPISFRAGGWMISMNGLKAAADAGIKIETSSRTAFSTASFNSQGHNYIGPWKALVTTQPYWISPSDQNKATSKENSFGLYETPNNGGDSWASSIDALYSRFKSNYPTDQLSSKRMVTYISHPDFFNKEGPKIGVVLSTISTIQAENDDGPVIFTTLSGYYLSYAR